MRIRKAVSGSVILMVFLVLVGCGGEPVASGTVKVDGQPLEEGNISFFPVDGKSTTAGGPIKGGQYTVNVPTGTMKVVISKAKIVGYKKLYNTPDAKQYPVTAEALPDRYNEKSELRLDVKPGKNQKDWELNSK
jgi:hypothetical protein